MSTEVLILSLFITLVFSAPTADDLLISLPDGQVRGAEYFAANDLVYYGFRGIPFATPPIGKLRFEAPIPPQPWKGTLNATEDGKACVGLRYSSDTQSEDCLFINVYTPSLKPAEKLPVLFFIFGGGFIMGDSGRDGANPDFFMAEDVIFVSFNYRLGPFGFLSTGDNAIRGNMALKDQVLALKWTHDNIALFGGDPEKITIFGGSTGGQSVGLHLLSKQTEGLFRGAILISGTALTLASIVAQPNVYTSELVSVLSDVNYGNDTEKLKEFLQSVSAEDLNNAADSMSGQVGEEDNHAWPTLEPDDDDAFLSESPYVLLESGRFHQVPTIIGCNAEEGLAFLTSMEAANQYAALFANDPALVIPFDLRPDTSDEQEIIARIKATYLKDGETFTDNLVALTKYMSDNRFMRALLKHAELQSKYSPVYHYQFAYYGRSMPPFIDGVEKARHGAEIPFLFNSTRYVSDTNPTDLLIQNRFVKLFANFIKYLNPTPEKTELLDVIWPMTSPTDPTYLNFNATFEVLKDLKGEQYRSWNETYFNYGEKPFLTF